MSHSYCPVFVRAGKGRERTGVTGLSAYLIDQTQKALRVFTESALPHAYHFAGTPQSAGLDDNLDFRKGALEQQGDVNASQRREALAQGLFSEHSRHR